MTHFWVTIPRACIILAKGVKQPDSPLLGVQENPGHLFLPTNEQDTNVVQDYRVYYNSSASYRYSPQFL